MHESKYWSNSRAVGKVRAVSAIWLFPYGFLLFPIADGHLGAKWVENVPMESGNLSEPSQMLTPIASL
jgi:hypothetical protein